MSDIASFPCKNTFKMRVKLEEIPIDFSSYLFINKYLQFYLGIT